MLNSTYNNQCKYKLMNIPVAYCIIGRVVYSTIMKKSMQQQQIYCALLNTNINKTQIPVDYHLMDFIRFYLS